jgi:hypothetical protein
MAAMESIAVKFLFVDMFDISSPLSRRQRGSKTPLSAPRIAAVTQSGC